MRVGVETPLEGDRRGDARQQMITGQQQPAAGDHRQTWPSECPGVWMTSQLSPPMSSCSLPRSRVEASTTECR